LVPEAERLEMLAHQRPVDLLYLKRPDDQRWALIKAVRPDVLVLTADHSYSDEELVDLKEFCADVHVLERQATVTTSERIRQLQMHLTQRLIEALPEVPNLREKIEGIIKR
jgi:glycerol-3-phosphate cytidylyltransferase-like family protein